MGNEARDTVTLTIDGRQVRVPAGTRVLDAAAEAGIDIKHFCYHPGLSAPGMCRMCLVDVENDPKLQPACVTSAAEGQVVHTDSEKARLARQGVLEFYLANHPLDCPVCDQAGDCRLQDFASAEGRDQGRFAEEKRVAGWDDFGAGIIYSADRCIMCTRCVRFMREVAGDERLCVVQRGAHSTIDTFFQERLDGSLWAGNIVDVCPVGALLSKDFLHRWRSWDLDSTPAICPNCSQGCNVELDTREARIVRMRPRFNPEVNSYWICDYGRYRYDWLNGHAGCGAEGCRNGGNLASIDHPMVRGEGEELRRTDWQEAMQVLLSALKPFSSGSNGAAGVVSAFSSNEDGGMLAILLSALGGDTLFRSVRAEKDVHCPGFSKLALRRDLAANPTGLGWLGCRRVGDDAGRGGLEELSQRGGAIIVLGDELADQPASFGSDADLFVYMGRRLNLAARNAHIVLPVTGLAQQEGTLTNHEGRVQRFGAALPVHGECRHAWQVLSALLEQLDFSPAVDCAADAFLTIAERFEAFSGLTYDGLGTAGLLVAPTGDAEGGGVDER